MLEPVGYKTLIDDYSLPVLPLDGWARIDQGALSANKRKIHFYWMQENEVIAAEAGVQQAFNQYQ